MMYAARRTASRCRFALYKRLGHAAILAILLSTTQQVEAIHVGTTPNVQPDNNANPINNSLWAASGKGDPGWANLGLTTTWLNGVYLGDGWVLSANHVGVAGITFGNSATVYQPVANQSFQVPNPVGFPGITQQYADLRLYRIQDDPGLPSLTIAAQPLALNDEVVFMSNGLHRALAESSWTTDNANPPNWTTVGSCSGSSNCFTGYYPTSGGRSWGTNNVANDNILGGTDASDADLVTVTGEHSIVNLTVYDRNSSNPFETQVIGGDSGSPVYHKRNGQWELAGIVLANYIFSGQDAVFNNTTSVYGNASAFADLSRYRSNILDILTAHADYSIVGDLNLDGFLNNSDLDVFVANWGYDNGTGQGSVTSWKHGDITHDGKTDVADFFRWRNDVNFAGSAAAIATLLSISSGTMVPESVSILQFMAAVVCAAALHRTRHRQFALVATE